MYILVDIELVSSMRLEIQLYVCFLCSSGCHQDHLFWLVFDVMFVWQNLDLPIFVREKEAKHFRSHYITQISCQGQDSRNHK
jgi:hypothetical protein